MPDLRLIADRYIALWNEPDAERRRALAAAAWAPEGRYADPLMAGQGPEGIAAMIERARAQFPGHAFALRGEPDGHGPFLRFAWVLAPQGGAPIARGTDVARLDGEGRFLEVTGFLDGSAAHG